MQQILLDGRYEIEHKIGEGGMATVYRGRDRRLNRRVAIKVLHSHYANDRDFLQRFQHEAQAAARLSHPHVVNVYDVGQDGDTHYIVMEYVEGTNLKTLINREAPLPIAQAVGIATAIARGLEAAHRFGLIHRDIKPQNIMVELDGHVRITDFGIAKSAFSTALTETGITFGTADYISPEQARGQSATPRSDIYALGVTLFEMLTGCLPFTGENTIAVALQHASDSPPPLRQINPQIPPQLEAIVLRALAKDPTQRPASAYEFAQLLNDYRNVAAQDTVLTPNIARIADEPARVRPAITPPGGNGNVTGRNTIPPSRPLPVRAPRQEGHSCGIFVLGMLLLAGVLGFVFMVTTDTFDNLFAGSTTDPARNPRATTLPDVTPSTTATVTPTPTITPTPTPVPVAVPNLIDRTELDAITLLQQADLVPVAGEPRYSDTVDQGRVMEQAIPPDTEIPEGESVTYTLSLGPRFVSIPDFVQRGLDSARNEAEALGLTVTIENEPSRSVSEGFIIRQNPNPAARLAPGSSITFVVSIGDKIRMPELTGRGEDQAKALLEATDGLTWVYSDPQGRNRLPNFDSYFPGEVVSMAFESGGPVQGGDWVPRGSRIVLGVRAAE